MWTMFVWEKNVCNFQSIKIYKIQKKKKKKKKTTNVRILKQFRFQEQWKCYIVIFQRIVDNNERGILSYFHW